MRPGLKVFCWVRLFSFVVLGAASVFFCYALTSNFEKIDPFILEELGSQGEVRFIVHLKEKADLSNAGYVRDWQKKGDYVYHTLVNQAVRSQEPLIELLNQKIATGKKIEYTSYWICNCLAVTGDRETLLALSDRADVERIVANRQIQVLEPAEPIEAGAPQAVEWNISKIRANEVWDTFGITGDGVVIGNMDTGVNWTHPALQSKYRGWINGQADHNYNWLDATSEARREPYDSGIHGTHTTGTLVGDDGAGNRIGVAPGAKWIAALIIGRDLRTFIEATHKGFQWMLAPTNLDGENPDPAKRPAVVNNSWGCLSQIPVCTDYLEFWDDVNAWISAGIFPEFSAGNEGPRSSSLRWPGDYPQSFTSGATDRNDVIWTLSSRGPSSYDESTKPNVTAPGVMVRSSIPNNGYGLMNGTSMAGPHVVGLVALLKEADPSLTIDDLKEIIQDTAIPLGGEIPNNTYGWGRIDAMNAVQFVLGLLPN